MIKVKSNDSIIDIVLKIKNSNEKEIVLEFPFWHPILHNYTSLKILKAKAWKKELIINTNDKTSIRIWKKLWIKYNLETKPDLPDKEYSFWEYFLYTLKNYFNELKIFITKKARENNFAKYQKIYTNWKIWFFVLFLVLSLILLVFIFYFAVNKTYINITPEIEKRPKWANFIFEKVNWDDLTIDWNIVKLKEIQKTVELTEKILTTWIDETEAWRANWRVKIQNFLEEDSFLIKNTRLVSKEWLVFLLDNEVKIPKMIKSQEWEEIPWEIETTVSARIDDINGKTIWTRWNIKKWVTLSLPWLKENSDKILAISTVDFEWWKNSTKRILTKQDLENAKNILKWKLESVWIKLIKEELKSENKAKNVKYEILWARGMIKTSDFKFSGLEKLVVWAQMEDFKITWSLKTTTYAFNKEIVLNKLKNMVNEWTLESVEKVSKIDEDSFSIVNELWREEEPFRIKATAQINVYYIQNFQSKSNNFIEKLKYQIAWLTKEEAEKILLNTWVISSVDIQIRPFFIKNISKIIDNIKFRIK